MRHAERRLLLCLAYLWFSFFVFPFFLSFSCPFVHDISALVIYSIARYTLLEAHLLLFFALFFSSLFFSLFSRLFRRTSSRKTREKKCTPSWTRLWSPAALGFLWSAPTCTTSKFKGDHPFSGRQRLGCLCFCFVLFFLLFCKASAGGDVMEGRKSSCRKRAKTIEKDQGHPHQKEMAKKATTPIPVKSTKVILLFLRGDLVREKAARLHDFSFLFLFIFF